MSRVYPQHPFISRELPSWATEKDIQENPCLIFQTVNFEAYLHILDWVMEKWRATQPALKGSRRGRPSIGALGMLKIYFLKMVFGWSYRRTAEAIGNDRRFREFIDFKHPPKLKTLWKWFDIFSRYRTMERIFRYDVWRIQRMLPHAGTKVMGIDSTLVPVFIQRNSRKQNKAIRDGKGGFLFRNNRFKRRQKDIDAGWGKRHGKNRFGYAAHVLTCLVTKLVMACHITNARVHDHKAAKMLLKSLRRYPENICESGILSKDSPTLVGDSAYTSEELHKQIESYGWNAETIFKKPKGGKLTRWQRRHNRKISSLRARVEHPFGIIKRGGNGFMLYCKGFRRASQDIFGTLWAYNLKRLVKFGH